MQPAGCVGRGRVAWFQSTLQAPPTAGYYRLYLRPLIEGATWMEDFGVFWLVTVLNADGTPPTPAASGTGYGFQNVATLRGTFGVHLINERLSDATGNTLTANPTDCVNRCPAKRLAQYAPE